MAEWWLGPTTPDQCGQNPACIYILVADRLSEHTQQALPLVNRTCTYMCRSVTTIQHLQLYVSITN